MKTIELYNPAHLGDNVFMMIFFYNIKKYIEEQDITIYYYCFDYYHEQIKEFICSERIHLFAYRRPVGLNLWIGDRPRKINWLDYEPESEKRSYNIFYRLFFSELKETLQFVSPPFDISYDDPDLLVRYNNLPEKYKNIDIIVINSDALSGQFTKNEKLWNQQISLWNQTFRIVTTKKIDGVECTTDNNMTIKSIAAISTHAKVVIAINTGVLPGFFNTNSLENIKKWYIFDKTVVYDFPRFEHKNEITDISLDELESLIR